VSTASNLYSPTEFFFPSPGTTRRTTDIWLVVKVPVLSEQITEVHPSVSTDCSLRTMAFFLAILRVPRCRRYKLNLKNRH
jgi:hypothetical protein